MSRRTLFLAALLVFGSARAWPDADPFQVFKQQKNILLPNKFTFLRVEYDSVGGYGEAEYDYDGRHWLRWQTDFPEADENFIFRLAELTAIDPNPHTEVRRLTAPDLFKFPLIYMSDPGWMDLSKEEVAALRNYLLQGGFLWVDDFWGDAEWENLERTMKEVFPGQTWQPVPKDHPIMNIVYPLKECPQVPARDFATMGWKYDPPAIHKAEGGGFGGTNVDKTELRGWFNAKGELMVVCTFNTDMGDGFEREAEDEWYFETYSTKAYAMGINIVVYALTH